jgi:hypothetical protein
MLSRAVHLAIGMQARVLKASVSPGHNDCYGTKYPVAVADRPDLPARCRGDLAESS